MNVLFLSVVNVIQRTMVMQGVFDLLGTFKIRRQGILFRLKMIYLFILLPLFGRDSWGRKWIHLVAMDALFFRDRTAQYDMKSVDRELTKAFISFRPHKTRIEAQGRFGIATGHWGCGVFNGDKQLKGTFNYLFFFEISIFSFVFSNYSISSSFSTPTIINLRCPRRQKFR